MLVVRDREAGNIIERVNTVEEGMELIRQFEAQDEKDGTYEEDFYEVAEVDDPADERIKNLRSLTGLSQTKFGDRYGIPMRTIQNWENGVSEAPGYVLDMLEQIVWMQKEEACVQWAVVDMTEDTFDADFAESRTEALAKAEIMWSKMSRHDQDRRLEFYVGLLNRETFDSCIVAKRWK